METVPGIQGSGLRTRSWKKPSSSDGVPNLSGDEPRFGLALIVSECAPGSSCGSWKKVGLVAADTFMIVRCPYSG